MPTPKAERQASVPFELASLPFDLYQRHRLAQEVVQRLRGHRKRLTILDVGGAPGHLKKFLPRDRVVVLDQETGGVGAELVADGRQLPFADRSVDLVVSLDTLEHLSSRQRPGFLRELARVSKDAVLLSAPFGGPQTEEAESILQGFLRHRLKVEHRFLDEHVQHGLPEREAVERALVRHLGPVVALPNGCLDRWLLLMALSFYLDIDPALAELKRQVSAYYNRNYYRSDNAEPAYRYLLVARRPPARPLSSEGLLAEPGRRRERIDFSPINALIEVTGLDLLKEAYRSIEALQERLADKDQNAVRLQSDKEQRQRVIDGMQAEMQNRHERIEKLQAAQAEMQERLQERSHKLVELGHALERRDEDLGRLVAEREALEARLASVGASPEAAELHASIEDLAQELQEIRATQDLLAGQRDRLTQEVRDRDARIAALDGQILREQAAFEQLHRQREQSRQHGSNLEAILERKEKRLGALTEHAGNLQHLLQESRREGERLARELATRSGRIADLERRAGNSQADAASRARQITVLEERLAELEPALRHWQGRAGELSRHADALDESRRQAVGQAEALRRVVEARQRRIADLEAHAGQLQERGERLSRQVTLLRDVAETRQQVLSEVNTQAERIRAEAAALRSERDVASQERALAREELGALRPRHAEALRLLQREAQAASEARQERDAARRRADERDRAAREQAGLTQRAQEVVAEQRRELAVRAGRLRSLQGELEALEVRLGESECASEELAASLDGARKQLQITRANLEARSRQAENLAEELGRLRGRRLVRLLHRLGLA